MGRPRKNFVTQTQALTNTPVIGSPLEELTPMFETITEPDVDVGRFEFSGTPQYNLPEPNYPKEWLLKWRPYWAEDVGGHIQHLQANLHYVFVTQEELPGYRMSNNVTPGNGSWDNRIFHPTRNTGTNVYLMKCPRAEFDARQKYYENQSWDRLRHINDKNAPEFSHGLNRGNTYRPKIEGEDAYKFQTETMTARSE